MSLPDYQSALRHDAYAFAHADEMRIVLEAHGDLSDWPAFADSWNDLGLDTYMADNGRYRRRRHAVFEATADGIRRLPHQPHFQTLDYNVLNGGIERWFEPVNDEQAESRSLKTILSFCRDLFSSPASTVQRWKVEVHQFRIEASVDAPGLPTPEGMHRDGVDYVLVLLVKRSNIASGTTMIGSLDGSLSSSFTLIEPFDAALVDDARACHGVTPVEPLLLSMPAYRDVLVVTFRKD
ncbi:MAG: 2OG-Fe dioxygenase family protein [Arenimonas sp.]